MHSAGVAQLVERNLAKVEVASSRLVSRSNTYAAGRFMTAATLLEDPVSGSRIGTFRKTVYNRCLWWTRPFLESPAKTSEVRLENKPSSTQAGVAQLVERNLAKVEVASSRLVSRSKL